MKTLKKHVSALVLVVVSSFFTPDLSAQGNCSKWFSGNIFSGGFIVEVRNCWLVGETVYIDWLTGQEIGYECEYHCPNSVILY